MIEYKTDQVLEKSDYNRFIYKNFLDKIMRAVIRYQKRVNKEKK